MLTLTFSNPVRVVIYGVGYCVKLNVRRNGQNSPRQHGWIVKKLLGHLLSLVRSLRLSRSTIFRFRSVTSPSLRIRSANPNVIVVVLIVAFP